MSRLRLLIKLKNHAYQNMKTTLATDKQISDFKGINQRIEKLSRKILKKSGSTR